MTKKSEGEIEGNEKETKKENVIEEEISKLTFSEKNEEELVNPLKGFKNDKYQVKIIMLSGDLESGAITSLICIASSRVGERIKAKGRIGAAVFPASLDIKAKPKARVFPDPVCPLPKISFPAIASGKVAF